MVFGNFWNILWIPILTIPLLLLYLRRRSRGAVRYSTVSFLKKLPQGPTWSRHLLILLRIAALVLLVIALMRPREGVEKTRIHTEGVDIVLALDVSGSMAAEDFTIRGKRENRLFVVKEVVREFIQSRKNDRIGIVVFGGRAYTLCPLTLDQGILLQFLDRARIGLVEDGTAIGDGITTALNRIRMTRAKSKVVILLTDGVQNAGKIDPKTAAEVAKAIGVKIYTIGVGSKGAVPFPMKDAIGRTFYQLIDIDLDEGLLQTVAQTTSGLYFRATDTEALEAIYHRIDALEKTKIESNVYVQYRERFVPFVMAGLLFILFEAALSQTVLRSLP
ncbi:MAG: VWA domain-containing protein [Candidatus Omnitrophica bacterium]|nr:VWA domain-containing protein [Candidatus Omnitrophota bacterium]